MLSDEENERYNRQILKIGIEKQEELKNKTVLQIGAGGLGSPLALYLVATGIGTLIIYEDDSLSLSNLGRQIIYSTKEVGKLKTDLTFTRLKALNPNVNVIMRNKRFTEIEASVITSEYQIDYLVDASDNFETKFLVNDIGLQYNIPFTIAGIEGFEGQLISVIPHKTACYRCLFGEVPTIKSNSPIAVVSSTCGVLGSMEANEIIKGLTLIGDRVLNSLYNW